MMPRATTIRIEYHDDVERALERFGDHEGMSEPRVVRWLEQFSDADLPLAVKVIQSVKYYNAVNVRAMTRQLFQIVVSEVSSRGHVSVAFVAVGDAGSGSNIVARVLRQLVRGTTHQMLSMLDVAKLKPGDIDAIVLIDDFSGTGSTLEKWWENVEPLFRPTGATLLVGLLVLNERARNRIETFADVLAVEELDTPSNVLAEGSQQFSNAEKTRLRRHCRRTGCGPRFEAGFGECGLLLAFRYGCPNNSLPILWYEGQNQNWRPLFNRRAI